MQMFDQVLQLGMEALAPLVEAVVPDRAGSDGSGGGYGAGGAGSTVRVRVVATANAPDVLATPSAAAIANLQQREAAAVVVVADEEVEVAMSDGCARWVRVGAVLMSGVSGVGLGHLSQLLQCISSPQSRSRNHDGHGTAHLPRPADVYSHTVHDCRLHVPASATASCAAGGAMQVFALTASGATAPGHSAAGSDGFSAAAAATACEAGLLLGRATLWLAPAAAAANAADAISSSSGQLAAELAGLQQRSTQCLLAADAAAACGAAADAAAAGSDADGAAASSRSAAGSAAARCRAWQGHVQPLLSDLDFVSAVMSHWQQQQPQRVREPEWEPLQRHEQVEVEVGKEEEEVQVFREAVEVAADLVAFADAQGCDALAALVRGMVSAAVAAAGQAAAAAVVPASRRNSHGHDQLTQLPGGPVITTEAAAAASAAGFAQAPPLPQLQQQPPAAMPPPLAALLLAPQHPKSLSVAAVTGSLLAEVVAATAAAAALHVRAAPACATAAVEWAPSLPAPRATASLNDVTPPVPCFFLQPDGVGSGGGNSSGDSGRRSGGEAAGGGGGGGVLSGGCCRHVFLEDC